MDDIAPSELPEEGLYIVERILDSRKKGRQRFYLLKWEGYDETTWEPAENILDHEMLDEYNRKHSDNSEEAAERETVFAVCTVCDSKAGPLLKCSQCSVLRHERCIVPQLGGVEADSSKFICELCQAEQLRCCVCRAPTQRDGLGLRCNQCCRAFHSGCTIAFDELAGCCFECKSYPAKAERILAMSRANAENGLPESEYLVKFMTWSYRRCFWVPESWLRAQCSQQLARFARDPLEADDTAVIRPSWCLVDKIMCEESLANAVPRYLVKWRDLGVEGITWETEESAGRFLLFGRIEIPHKDFSDALVRYRQSLVINKHWAPKVGASVPSIGLEASALPIQHNLKGYQVEGAGWVLGNWAQGRNCMLADEAGLVKTAQAVGVIQQACLQHGAFPVLIVCPSSRCQDWINEMSRSAPELHHVLIAGSAESLECLERYALFNDSLELPAGPTGRNLIKNHVVVTSSQARPRDWSILSKIPWQMIVVDGASHPKGPVERLAKRMGSFNTCFRLLLAEDPPENNMVELLGILSFLDPEALSSPGSLGARLGGQAYGQVTLSQLQELLQPRILRRTRRDVGLDEAMPPKREIIVPVSMTGPQRALYKSIVRKNCGALKGFGAAVKKGNLAGIWMELRKCVNHPYLIVSEPQEEDPEKFFQRLLSMSGKLELLDRMLERLKQQGRHRVLIFSRMPRMLDMYLSLVRAGLMV